MAENKEKVESPHRRFAINGQYIKDLSFENPNPIQNLMNMKDRPKIDVSVDLKAQKVQDKSYEVTMDVTTSAKSEDKTIFMVELSYGAIFTFAEDLPEEQIQYATLVDCPFVMFPFARRVIADITRDGGFPPLLLEPIDFHTLFVKRVEEIRNQQENGKGKAAAS